MRTSPETPGWRAPGASALRALANRPLALLMADAAALRDVGHGERVTYSRKVFVPLTKLCRDVCHYCTFARRPGEIEAPYLAPEQVLAIARAGAERGCKEALFTLGDKPELRYPSTRRALEQLGFTTTVEYLAASAALVLESTGLLPHVNAGVLGFDDYTRLRPLAPSMGLMLESTAPRLSRRGGPHFGSPDKHPKVRLESLRLAGEARIPTTTGLLIGIGETREERLDALLAIREVHAAHRHVQEVIVQNFAPKPGTRMARVAPPPLEELLWTIAMARLALGPAMTVQTPPNLNDGRLAALIAAGINDWGGVSPVTIDHVNPEAPWPQLERLADETAAAGKELVERLTIHPPYVREMDRWVDASLRGRVLALADASGHAREEAWCPGSNASVPAAPARRHSGGPSASLARALERAAEGRLPSEAEIVTLFEARGDACAAVLAAADALRVSTCGDRVSYVVTRNINYTNVCTYKCTFCAFSKGRVHESLRGAPYLVGLDEIARRAAEAWARGATEVCMQGGIHPSFDGTTYLAICEAARRGAPDIHVHAFSPLEVAHGASTLGLPVREYLGLLKARGLASLPGTAAEVLDDEVRATLCPDKLDTDQWLEVIAAAHEVGLRTTSTLMFGHVDSYASWARHLRLLRELQQRTGGITEFVPLPFVPMEAPLYRRGRARRGPTFREVLLVHAVARLALHPVIRNVQASWPKLGPDGVRVCLAAGANDLGGTLMNESISRAAGATHGEELPPAAIESLIKSAGRLPFQRTTFYDPAPTAQRERSFSPPALAPVVTGSVRRTAVRSVRPAAEPCAPRSHA